MDSFEISTISFLNLQMVNQDYDRDVHAVCVDFVLFDLVNQGSREPQESEDNEKNKVPRFFYVHI